MENHFDDLLKTANRVLSLVVIVQLVRPEELLDAVLPLFDLVNQRAVYLKGLKDMATLKKTKSTGERSSPVNQSQITGG